QVRVALIGFDNGSEPVRTLDGVPAKIINSDLTRKVDVNQANVLSENAAINFIGTQKHGAIDIPDDLAREMLNAQNQSGLSNSGVVRPWANGQDVTGRHRGLWIIDFGLYMPLETACQYEKPFEHVQTYVYPDRQENRRASYRNF